MKLKLLKEIAEEHELDWDPAASEKELLKSHEDLLVCLVFLPEFSCTGLLLGGKIRVSPGSCDLIGTIHYLEHVELINPAKNQTDRTSIAV